MCTAFHRRFDILEQQDKASLFDKADREGEGLAPAEVVFDFVEESCGGVVGEELVGHGWNLCSLLSETIIIYHFYLYYSTDYGKSQPYE